MPHAGASIAEMESETDSRPDSDKFRCRNEPDSFQTSDQSIVARTRFYICVLYIVAMGLRKPRKRMKFGQRYLSEKSSSQLMRYSLDTGVRYSTYVPIFKSQKGSSEALNFLIIIS